MCSDWVTTFRAQIELKLTLKVVRLRASMVWFRFIIAFALHIFICTASDSIPPYDLSILPENLPHVSLPDKVYNKHIPRKIWMAVKDINDEQPGHVKEFFKRNPEWEANVCDNDCKDKFMNTTFGGILRISYLILH